MITKGIIVSIPVNQEENKYGVRLPFFEDATEDSAEIIYEATLSQSPSINQGYAIGDIVYCAFEDNDNSRPVIIGKLFSRELTNTGANITADDLEVLKNVKLPKNTSIGNATINDVNMIPLIKNKVNKTGDTISGLLTLSNTLQLTSGKNVDLLDDNGSIIKSMTTDRLIEGGITSVSWGDIIGNISNQTDLKNNLDAKQDNLVSGTNIKTVDNQSLLGSGNIETKTKFIKGTPINLYDTDGTTILSSKNPEDLVFADSTLGDGQVLNLDYSFDEINTGVKWVNGKWIYQKTIFVASLPNNTTQAYNHSIANVDEIWLNPKGSFIKWTSTTAPFNNISRNASGFNSSSMINIDTIGKTSFTIGTTYDRSSLSAYVTLCYTKTTD